MSVDYIEIGGGEETIKIFLRTSERIKHITLKVTNIGKVELVVPKRYNFTKAKEFVQSKENWIRGKLSKHVLQVQSQANVLPIFGEMHEIVYVNAPTIKINIEDGKILICDSLKHFINTDLKYFLRSMLKSYILIKAHQMAKILKVEYTNIIIKDTKSRWGSCSSSGTIYFSWRLVFAPSEVIDYVIAHEISHLVEMNHSKDFWRTVFKIYPNYKLAKFWLKKNGIYLFQYLANSRL